MTPLSDTTNISADATRAAGRSAHGRPLSRRRSRVVTSVIAAMGLGLASAVGGVAASASAASVGTYADLVTALSSCAPATTVSLTSDISMPTQDLTASCDAILDLNGHTLALNMLTLATGVNFEVTDSQTGGELDAINTGSGAGIQTSGATFTIDGGTIDATGAPDAAGIGGSDAGDSGDIVINAGTVTATAGTDSEMNSGAGIGSGAEAPTEDSVTITGGTVTANGGVTGAGIGSGIDSGLGSVVISGGVVNATAQSGPGIGVGNEGDGTTGTITIGGGAHVTATATNDLGGAGIGSGQKASIGTITINDSTVVATGTFGGAGIGGGVLGSATSITINSGANVTANAPTDAEAGVAIGGGGTDPHGRPPGTGGDITIADGATVTVNGPDNVIGSIVGVGGWTLSLAGTLYVQTGTLSVPAGITPTITSTGKLLGTPADPTGGGTVSDAGVSGGAGGITNHGAIGLATASVASTIIANTTDHNYLVTFVPLTGPDSTVRVFADNFADGYRTVPATSDPLSGWNTAPDGSGTWLTTTTALTADLTVYEVHNVVAVAPLNATATAGDTTTYSATTDGVTDTSGVVVTSNDPTDVITGLNVVATKAGAHTITVTVNGVPSVTTLTVVAGPADSVAITAPAPTVGQGKSLTFAVTAADQFGNPVDASSAVLSSSMPTDVINGLTVTFPHASPHTITATLGAFTSSVTVQVIPTAVAVTGVDTEPTLGLGLGALLLGGLVLLLGRRRQRS
ncbi:MAG TPA: LPXTG cell wall anchor domain-containing protein [Galbitalea sp.]|nr:LPXTG cell wall anchor domain-containing protein [Galbitalea sp.]